MNTQTHPLDPSFPSKSIDDPNTLQEREGSSPPKLINGSDQPSSEVRFAVVMYGGVSLAIYMNGIAQELLRMVRATAGPAYSQLQGSERVYRKLSYLLAGETLEEAEKKSESDAAIPTRFIIDIISGSSAGGINGIFLSKALANGQDISALKKLWVEEGDMSLLINDKKSVEKPLSVQKPPESLLNSRRMYLKLLQAFDDMDQGKGGKTGNDHPIRSPLVDQLDLFVTSTDIQGITLPLRLADKVVYERRYRNVLHFIYSTKEVSGEKEDRNDFNTENNPFLAYAARCTSAFPFAFEPMRLSDIDEILSKYPKYSRDKNSLSDSRRWELFYQDYLNLEGVSSVPFPERSFGDGGYLDNKPFSYATEMLGRRQADGPVDRKLIYIEPSPEHPEEEMETDRKPNAIENTLAALLKLPLKETIREDLEKVKERNRIIDRLNRILRGVDQDIDHVETHTESDESRGALQPMRDEKELWAKKTLTDQEWAELDLAGMIKRKGQAYTAYHRLEIESVTDDLAILVTRVAGFDVESDYLLIIRSLIRAWRKKTYVEYAEGARPTLNRFLHTFNLSYPIRRLAFLRSQIDRLYRLDQEARRIMEFRVKQLWAADSVERTQRDKEFQGELLRIKKTLNQAYLSLKSARRLVRSRQAPIEGIQQIKQEIFEAIKAGKKKGDGPSILEYFLGPQPPPGKVWPEDLNGSKKVDSKEENCEARARQFLDQHPEIRHSFDALKDVLGGILSPAMEEADRSCREVLRVADPSPDLSQGALAARICLHHYYEKYDNYDMIIFPLLYGTDIGETDQVEIIRISPEDATVLIDEKASCCRKLAGTSLGHFGAFMKELWRENDILWGRLDGAERLITALIPGHPQIRPLIGEAQAAIVWETIHDLGPEKTKELLVESLMRPKTPEGKARAPETLRQFLKGLKTNAADSDVKGKLESRINELEISDHYLAVFESQSRLEPQQTLESAARATTVVGQMLSDISAKSNLSNKSIGWVARLGQIFWGLIEIAVPRSIPNLLFRHWINLLYLFEVVLIVGGTLLLNVQIQKFSLIAFALTLAIHLTVLILHDFMQFKNRWFMAIKALGLLLFVWLILLGIAFFLAVTGIVNPLWSAFEKIREWFAGGWLSEWKVRLGITVFFTAFLVWNIRNDFKARDRKKASKG